jgi:carbohydrate kinase (thermoresistant glucokinase family)
VGQKSIAGEFPVVVMGVSGSGKTTVGQLLAQRAGWPFLDADDLHPPRNLLKMQAGTPLTDADRWPWLGQVAEWIAQHANAGCVVACSALKRAYRDLMREADPGLRLVYLQAEREQITERINHRAGHFFPLTLVAAQFADLEPPTPDEDPITIPIGQTSGEEVEAILAALAG